METKKLPKWDELKWYHADQGYSFPLSRALVKTKGGSCQVRAYVRAGEWYIPLPLIEKLPSENVNH